MWCNLPQLSYLQYALFTIVGHTCGATRRSFPYIHVPDHMRKRSSKFQVEMNVNFHVISDGEIGRISQVMYFLIMIMMTMKIVMIIEIHTCI